MLSMLGCEEEGIFRADDKNLWRLDI